MTEGTKKLLYEAYEYCETHGKSAQFTIQYMQDFADTELETVFDFLFEELEENIKRAGIAFEIGSDE